MTSEKRNSLLLFAAPFLVTLIFYLFTVCRTVYTGDSGELAFAIHSLGIAHPPGYPLLTVLGRAFLVIIPGNTALILNLLSALLASCSAGVAAFVVRMTLFPASERQKRPAVGISIAVACLFGFAADFWAVAVGIEVHTLGMLLLVLSLLCLLKSLETGGHRYILLSVYLFSLGLANHLTITVLALPIVIALFRLRAPLWAWISCAAMLVAGVSVYLFIPIRSATNPILDWDHPATFGMLLDHITARRYQGFVSGLRFDNYFVNLWRSLGLLAKQYPLWLGVLGIIGLFVSGRIKGIVKLIFIVMIAQNFLSVALYDIPDIEQYYLPSFFLAAPGIGALILFMGARFGESKYATPAAAIALCLAALTAAANFGRNDQSDNRLAHIYGMNILNSLSQDAILVSLGDNSNSTVQYMHFVEGERPDVEIYDPVKTYRYLARKYGMEAGINDGYRLCFGLLESQPERAFLVKEHMLRRRAGVDYSQMPLSPQGMVYRLGDRPPEVDLWNRLEFPAGYEPDKLDIKGLTMLANLYLCRGEDRQYAGDSSSALDDFRRAREIASSSHEASIHNSLGIFFRHHGWPGLAESEYTEALESRHLTAFERANINVNLGNLSKDKGDYARALEYYNAALAINTNNYEARYNLTLTNAYLSLGRGDIRGAVTGFEEALSISGADKRLIYNLGILYDQSLGDTARAIYNYQRFAELAPEMPESQTALRRAAELSRFRAGNGGEK